jgi:asparagine synthase (glutamine-hydrolysing)
LLFSRRAIANPKIPITPPWLVAWGQVDCLTEEVTWRESRVAIIQAEPAFSPSGRFVVVGDLWRSPQPPLTREVIFPQASCESAQIVAQMWERWGVESLQQLQGMFALVVWDREKEELWLGRDRVGAKTLYYTTSGAIRWVAPRARSLSRYRSDEIDLVALRDYLCCAFVPGSQTLWRDVRELRPGTSLQFPEGKVRVYWQPQERICHAEQPLEWHGKQVRSLLEELVQEALPSGEPVGVYLSGGIDSSCITALAAKLHDYPIHTYSIHFGEKYPSELEFANLVASHCQTQHHILEISPKTIWKLLPETLAYLDDPIGEGLTVPNLLLGRLAKESVNVILNGEGGDPCFAGPKNKPMLLNSLYGSIIAPATDPVAAYLRSFQKCFVDLPRLFQPEIWQKVATAPSVFAADLQDTETTFLNRLMLLNIKFKGADYILTKVNNLTQAAGVEGRSPLFDPRIVELSMQVSPEYKLSGAEEKAVLKSAVADLLPEVILNRPKSGMIMSMQQWFRRLWYRQAKELLLSRNAAIAPYLNQSLIRDWLNYRGEVWHRYGLKLWLLVTLEIWLQVHKARQ